MLLMNMINPNPKSLINIPISYKELWDSCFFDIQYIFYVNEYDDDEIL